MSETETTLRAMADALEAKKMRDAQALARAQSLVHEIDSARAAIEAEILRAAETLDPGDIVTASAFEAWRAAQHRRMDALAAERAHREALVAERRAALARSNGERRAVERIADAAAEERRVAETARQRRTSELLI